MDGTASIDVFEHAARYESELTDRQRQVLRLIAADKTNIEIAEALGMTLAGAKWHVSELLSKLSLDSREAAAEYHRWRSAPHRRASRHIRGLFSATALKLGLASAGGLAAVAVGAAVVFSMNGDDGDFGPAVPGLPFYMEATFTHTEEHYSTNAARRFWYQDGTHNRTEADSPMVTRNDPGFEVDFGDFGTATIVRDGSKLWRQTGTTYKGIDLADFENDRSLERSDLGPILQDSIEAYAIAEAGEWDETTTRRARFIGRDVVVMEWALRDANGKVVQRRERWIDEERLLVVKAVTEIRTGNEIVVGSEEVTKIQYGQGQPPDRFVWVPPPGTVEDTCPTTNGTSSDGNLPSPFLRVPVSEVPARMQLRVWGTERFPDRCDAALIHYGFEDGPQGSALVLVVREDLRDPSSVFGSAHSTTVDLGGTEARLGVANDGGRSVSWLAGPVGIEVRSTALTDVELIDFAKAMVAANQ